MCRQLSSLHWVAYQVLSYTVYEIFLFCLFDPPLQSVLISHEIGREILVGARFCENMTGEVYRPFEGFVDWLVLEGTGHKNAILNGVSVVLVVFGDLGGQGGGKLLFAGEVALV